MAEKFDVGEVAIFNRPGSQFNGVEVTVTGPLARRLMRDYRDGRMFTADSYLIDGPFDHLPHVFSSTGKWSCLPEHLRKRPPPQDWVSICNLTSVPTQERIEEFA